MTTYIFLNHWIFFNIFNRLSIILRNEVVNTLSLYFSRLQQKMPKCQVFRFWQEISLLFLPFILFNISCFSFFWKTSSFQVIFILYFLDKNSLFSKISWSIFFSYQIWSRTHLIFFFFQNFSWEA